MNLLTEVNLNRLKLGLYGGLLCFSLFTIIAVPLSKNTYDFCILYWERSSPGNDSNCNFTVAIAVIFQLFYGLFRLVTLILLVLGILSPDFMLFSDLFQLIYTGVDTVAWFLVLVSACILSAGINATCNRFNNCRSWNDVSRIHVAEAGAWISFILWLVLVLVGVFWLFRQGKIPFLSRGPAAHAHEGGSAASGGTSPQMDTPSATGEPKY